MYRQAQTQSTGAEVKWLLLATLLALLVIAFTCSVAAAVEPVVGPDALPAQLPDDMDQYATPMATARDGLSRDQLVMRIWMVLEDQRSGHLDRAEAAWSAMKLPEETDVYRHLAIVQAMLGMGQLEKAGLELQTARSMAPDLSVTHYYTAIWQLEMSEVARDYPDSINPFPMHKPQTRLASQAVDRGPAAFQSSSMYKAKAMMSLEKVVQFAGDVDFGQPLLPGVASPGLTLEPTVGDLLESLYAEHYLANSHNALGSLYLESGMLEAAESHLDSAAELGAFVGFGYYDLGEQFERQGRHSDAMRVFTKAMRHDGGFSLPAQKALESLRNALLKG